MPPDYLLKGQLWEEGGLRAQREGLGAPRSVTCM